jgi:serine phosphatase RsbU (regulator of sigma subunit)
MEMLVHAISKSLERRELLEQNRRYREELESANQVLKEALQTLEKDQEAGRRVQQELLPPSPFVTKSGYVIEHKIIPSLYLSGDFIDFTYYNDRYFAFYLTDVSGHGASSAFATIWLKHVAQALVEQGEVIADNWLNDEGKNPFLHVLNEELLTSRLGHHMTCFTGLIDMQEHKLRYSVAGHLPMPLISNTNGAYYLEGKGRPLGLFPDQQWDVVEVDFPEGASLIGFSDGVLEVLPPKDLLEKEAYLLDLMSCDAQDFSQVLSALQLNALQSAPDDIAVLSIRRCTALT